MLYRCERVGSRLVETPIVFEDRIVGQSKINVREIAMQGARVYRVNGLIDDCGAIVAKGAAEGRWFDFSTLKEPYRIEGKKTMGYELAEQLAWSYPDWIIYPTGGGTGTQSLRVAPRRFNAGLTYAPSAQWSATVNARLVSAMYFNAATPAERGAGYGVIDAKLQMALPIGRDWSAFVAVVTTTRCPLSAAGTRYARLLPVPVPASASRCSLAQSASATARASSACSTASASAW